MSVGLQNVNWLPFLDAEGGNVVRESDIPKKQKPDYLDECHARLNIVIPDKNEPLYYKRVKQILLFQSQVIKNIQDRDY
jgi:hypothetical protein